jgi:hypothetical protein
MTLTGGKGIMGPNLAIDQPTVVLSFPLHSSLPQLFVEEAGAM